MQLADRLYGEVDDSCALCGIHGSDLLTIHHIDSNHNNDVYENTIVLCYNCHTRFHQGKGITESQVRDRKRHLIYRTLTTYGLNALKIADRKDGIVVMPFLVYHLVELGYMEQKENVMGYGHSEGIHGLGLVQIIDPSNPNEGQQGQDDVLARFSITDRGHQLLAAWFDQ